MFVIVAVVTCYGLWLVVVVIIGCCSAWVVFAVIVIVIGCGHCHGWLPQLCGCFLWFIVVIVCCGHCCPYCNCCCDFLLQSLLVVMVAWPVSAVDVWLLWSWLVVVDIVGCYGHFLLCFLPLSPLLSLLVAAVVGYCGHCCWLQLLLLVPMVVSLVCSHHGCVIDSHGCVDGSHGSLMVSPMVASLVPSWLHSLVPADPVCFQFSSHGLLFFTCVQIYLCKI